MKYTHTNLIAKDWIKLSKFYQKVFNCVPVPPQRDLSGKWVDILTGLKSTRIQGEHLRLPGYDEDGPTLEIFSYNGACSKTRLVLDKLLEKPVSSPVFPLNLRKLFQKLKFWNSLNGFTNNEKRINTLGFAHIAFAVNDVKAALEQVNENGGKLVGEIVSQKYPNGKIGTFVYCRDPEGNIIELQKWE